MKVHPDGSDPLVTRRHIRDAVPVERWRLPREGAKLCFAPGTLRRTLAIALIVGTLLSLINQGDRVFAGDMNTVTWLRLVANYLIPWAVSSLGFLSATRRQAIAAASPEQAGPATRILNDVRSPEEYRGERLHTPVSPAYQGLHPRVVWLWRTTGGSAVVLAIAASMAAATVFAEPPPRPAFWVLIGILGLGAAWTGAHLRYATWAFGLQASDLHIRRGVLIRTTSVIPLARIQHVDTRQDVLERWLGLARIVVYTAGIRGAEIAVPGLRVADAEAMRDRLAAIAGAADRAV